MKTTMEREELSISLESVESVEGYDVYMRQNRDLILFYVSEIPELIKILKDMYDNVHEEVDERDPIKTEIEEEVKEKVRRELRDRYGSIIDGIGVRRLSKTESPFITNAHEIDVRFRNRFALSDYIPNRSYSQTYRTALTNAMIETVDLIEKLALERENINAKNKEHIPGPFKELGINVRLSHNLDDDVLVVNPKTYYELLCKMGHHYI